MESEIRIISAGEPLYDHLEQFKMYASVPDGSRDGMLLKILKRAMLTVQEYADKALLPCTLELTAYDVEAGDPVRLYQGGTEVLSAENQDGESVEFTQEGNRLRIQSCCKALVVVYRNSVNIPEAEALQPVCWELATAIYDGEDAKVQGDILKKTYGML